MPHVRQPVNPDIPGNVTAGVSSDSKVGTKVSAHEQEHRGGSRRNCRRG
jgi:hypothetical protein